MPLAVSDMEPMISDPGDKRAYHLSAIDMLRGLVIVIMAIDHVRDVTAGLFATR